MDIREVLEQYSKGEIDAAKAERLLRLDFIERIGDHTVFDHAREARKGIPEIVFGETKTPTQVAQIVQKVLEDREAVLVSRASGAHHAAVLKAVGRKGVRYHRLPRMIVVDRRSIRPETGKIGLLAAGTSDRAVADEAQIVAETMGCKVIAAHDVGIAAFHRFLGPLEKMLEEDVDVIIVVAGMEGALPTIVSSFSSVPVIGVPSSIGYGLGGKGEAALLGMLQSCSPGLVVVNIDNGIGAGATAALISRRCHQERSSGEAGNA
ncbi:MAG: nickel pincer cofactor biosynthesis protein LarB [Methanomassiliicoccales archaeon]|jgi:NCAIR mutase (PurE)-related protein